MAEISRKVLQLEFKDARNKSLKLTINKPAEGLTGETVRTVMDTIIASNAYGEVAKAVSIVGAKFIVQEETALTL